MTPAGLIDLLNESRPKNEAAHITGLLLYLEGSFMQVLEGSRKAVTELMEHIKMDPRHRKVKILEQGMIPRRHFPDWEMAFLDNSQPELHRLPGYSRYLVEPVTNEDFFTSKARSRHLLLYFKTVMQASQTSLHTLLLDQSLQPPTKKKAQAKRKRRAG